MKRPTYEELQRRVEELERLVNSKVDPPPLPFETIDLLAYELGKGWLFDFVGRAISDLTGYGPMDFFGGGMNWLDVVHEEDRRTLEDSLNKAMASDKYFNSEHRIVNRQGKVRWVKMCGRISCGEDGAFLFLQVRSRILPLKNILKWRWNRSIGPSPGWRTIWKMVSIWSPATTASNS
jgi:PAS domain S-box-containing protein